MSYAALLAAGGPVWSGIAYQSTEGGIMSKNEIKLGKIKIQMGDTEVELTIDEVKELKDVLVGLFPEQTERIIERYRDWYPWWPQRDWVYGGNYDYKPYQQDWTTIASSDTYTLSYSEGKNNV